MSTPLLSVVMPVYNVAAYLPRCLDSLIAQTLQPDEIIAVDDGATDDCPAILADYARRMPNLRVIRQQNGGLSAARNTGIDRATGKYLAFIDSDDFAEPGLYAQLVGLAEADALDMVLVNANYHFEGREADRPIYVDIPASGPLSGAAWLLERLQRRRFLHMVWMHLYRREFLAARQFRFVPDLVHEDVVWTTRALLLAERIRYDPTPLINYRIPLRSFTPEQNRRRLERLIDSSVFNARQLAVITEEAAAAGELRRELDWALVDGAMSVFHKIEKLDAAEDRQGHYRKLLSDGFFGFLWSKAGDFSQRRKVARNYLTARVACLST